LVGSLCTGNFNGKVITGTCFESDTGSLECGKLTSLEHEYNGVTQKKHINLDATGMAGLHRCPRGYPTKMVTAHSGDIGPEYKVMLVGGCMLPNDVNYNVNADVHIAETCETPGDLNKGCMFPGAQNFDPVAQQPGMCKYKNLGCMSVTALNYNSEASDDDPNDPCIEPIKGCTLATDGYAGVDSNTPNYESQTYGSALRSIGYKKYAFIQGVINYNAAANVLDQSNPLYKCVPAVEGCMDSTMANYEPRATVNTGTWCIPIVIGCMMPEANAVGPSFDAGVRAHLRDGVALNFDPSVTVHDVSMCVVERWGCMDSEAANYEMHSNKELPGYCIPKITGCLNPDATNFGCTTIAPAACDQATLDSISNHDVSKCQFGSYAPPSAPPQPAFPGQTPTSLKTATGTASFVGTAAECKNSGSDEIIEKIVAAASSGSSTCDAKILDSSCKNDPAANEFTVYYQIGYAGTEAEECRDAFANNVVLPATATLLATASGLTVVSQGLSAPVKGETTVILPVPAPPPPPPVLSVGAIVGIVVGAVVGFAVIAGALYYVIKVRGVGKAVVPAY